MKKIFVDVYLAYNLGDDLFLDILSKKYPNSEFTVNYVGSDYDSFIEKYNNIERRKYNLSDKILQKLHIKDSLKNYKDIADSHDAIIFIGGSIFREESYHKELYKERTSLTDEFIKLDKPVFVLGSNFGPYESEEFINDYKNFFRKCEDVCFRDKYSYEIFKELDNVRYEPDIVFQLKCDNFNRIKNNKIGFSVIDVNHKVGLEKYEEEYISCTVKSIEKFVENEYECCLISFCQKEGDLTAINKILERLEEKIKSKIEIYEYKGDIKESFEKISELNLFIAARFHANIISLLLNIPILPVIYSEKTTNMLKDIGFNNNVIMMNNLEKMNDWEIITRSLKNNIDIRDTKQRAKNQFNVLSKFIES